MSVYLANDFISGEETGNWRSYTSNKEFKIFGKTFNREPLELSVHEKQSLEASLEKINEYMTWLSEDAAKDVLIAALCGYVNQYSSVTAEELVKTSWFESLEIYRVLLTITEDGKIGVDFEGSDNYDEEHSLVMELLEEEVHEVMYDG
jgi:hypothetical protein